MKKQIIIAASILMGFSAASASTTINLQGVSFSVDTLEHYKAGPGMTYTRLKYTNQAGRSFISHVTTADTKTEGFMIREAMGKDRTYGTEKPSAIAKRKDTATRQYLAGINSDFYVNSTFAAALKNAHGMAFETGIPNACAVSERMPVGYNNALTDGAHDFYHFIVGEKASDLWIDVPTVENVLYINANWRGLQTWINGLPRPNYNEPNGNADIVIWNSMGGVRTGSSEGHYEVAGEILEGQQWTPNKWVSFKVVSPLDTKGNMTIPTNGIVICGSPKISNAQIEKLKEYKEGTVFKLKPKITLKENNSTPVITSMAGGDVRVLDHGKVRGTGTGYERDRYISSSRTGAYPHTFAGFSQDKSKVVFCVVDGKSSSPTQGCSYVEGADLMASYGCYDAVNFDNGGSSTMYLQSPGVVNTPCDGAERAVTAGLFMTIDGDGVDSNEVAEIRFKDWAKTLAVGETYTPVIYGYNKAGRLVNTNIPVTSLQFPEGYGEGVGQNFTARKDGYFPLTAVYKDMKCAIPVKVGNWQAGVAEVEINKPQIVVGNGEITTTAPLQADATWCIYSISGAVVAQGETPAGSTLNVNVSALPTGLYIATLTISGHTYPTKFIR